MAVDADLTIICGNDVVVPVTLYSGDSGTTALNLTGITGLIYTVKRQAGEGYAALITKTLGAGTAVVSAVAGTITITFLDTDTLISATERLAGHYHHECQVVDSGGLKSTVFKGILTIDDTGIA